MVRRVALLLLCTLLLPAAGGQLRSDPEFRENEHYRALPVAMHTDQPGVTVHELFSYTCRHCRQLAPVLHDWATGLPDDVHVERVPAVYSERWLLLARAYHAAEVCRALDVTHEATFRALHEERRALATVEEIAAFYAAEVAAADSRSRCRSEADFRAAFESFEVASAVQRTLGRSQVWQADAIPALIVDGRWRIEWDMAGSNAVMIDVVDYLVRRARAEGNAGAGSGRR